MAKKNKKSTVTSAPSVPGFDDVEADFFAMGDEGAENEDLGWGEEWDDAVPGAAGGVSKEFDAFEAAEPTVEETVTEAAAPRPAPAAELPTPPAPPRLQPQVPQPAADSPSPAPEPVADAGPGVEPPAPTLEPPPTAEPAPAALPAAEATPPATATEPESLTPETIAVPLPPQEPAMMGPPSISASPDEPPPVEDAEKPNYAPAVVRVVGVAPANAAAPAPDQPPAGLAPEVLGWWTTAATLEKEAEVAPDPETRAIRLAAAASIHRDRVGDWVRAEALYRAARAAGRDDADMMRDLGDLVATREDFAQLVEVLEHRANLLDDPKARAEAYQDAALVARNNLRNDDEAVRLFGQAVRADPDDYFSLRLLRDMYLRLQNWRELPDVLLRMAELAPPALAAEYHVERGQVFESRLCEDAAALGAYLDARAADPAYGPAFMALERCYRRLERWTALAELYEAESALPTGADARFWQLRAAHTWWMRVGDPERAGVCFAKLGAGGFLAAEAFEYRAFLNATGRWAQLAETLERGAGARGATAACDLFAAGLIHETRLSDADRALACYRAGVAADASALPALEAALRILRGRQDHAGQVALCEDILGRVGEPELVVTLHFLVAEILEHGLAQLDAARAHYRAVLDLVPGYLPALDGLQRVLEQLGDPEALATLHEQRAILVDDPDAAALHLTLAGLVWNGPALDLERAGSFFERALAAAPTHPVALDAYARTLRQAHRWADLARVLHAAAQASREGDDAIGRLYEAGRIYHEHLGDTAAATACFKGALELSPGFMPARVRLRGLLLAQGDIAGAYGLLRAEADATEHESRRTWLLLHALLLGQLLPECDRERLLDGLACSEVGQQIAAEMRAALALRVGGRAAAAEALRQLAGRATDPQVAGTAWVHAAHLLFEEGDAVGTMQALSMVLAGDRAPGLPMVAVARFCETLGYWEETARALSMSSDPAAPRYLGRIQELYLQDAEAALTSYRQAVQIAPDDLVAWLGVERLLTAASDHAELARVHASLAESTDRVAICGLHGLLGAHLFEGISDLANARQLYQRALTARPGRGKAFDGLLRVLIAAGDGEAIKRLFAENGQTSGMELANALIDVGDLPGALAALQAAAPTASDPLPVLLLQERVLADLGRWQEVFETLAARRRLVASSTVLAWIEREQRRLLAEHLAGTDDAHTFYTAAYEQHPDDPEVLEALANISQARGETGLAIQYLERLATVASTREERLHVRRLVARIHVKAGQGDRARDAYLAALEVDPEDLQSLDGLEDLATGSEDWRTVVGILARKGALFHGDDQVEIYARIARIWDTRLEDAGIAIESWRKVVELCASHREALDRLTFLTAETGSWAAFVDHAQVLAKLLAGAERAAMLRQIGLVYETRLHSLPDAIRFLEAASADPHPDADAARARERIHTERGEWEQVIKALLALAQATSGDEKVESLLKAARLRATTLHNRKAASEIYALVVEVAPSNAEALRFQCAELFAAEDYARAVGLFERLEPIEATRDIEDFDEQIEVAQFYFHFGETLRLLGRHAEAVSRYEHTLRLNDTHLPSLEALGPLYMEAGDWTSAENIYRKLLQLTGGRGDPAFLAGIYTQLGYIQRHMGDLEKAKKRFNKALELRQNDIRALLGLAAVQYDRGEWSALLNVYNNVIFHARERVEVIAAYLAKGFVLDRKLNLPEKAADHYRKSLNFDPDEPRALLLLGELTLRRREWSEAGRLFEQALASQDIANIPAATRANLHLALAAVRAGSGRVSEVPVLLERAIAADVTLSEALAHADPTNADDLTALVGSRLAPPGL